MTEQSSAENGACRVGCGHPPADHENGECMHLCDCAWPAEDDALALALRILAPGEDDNVTLGELRRECGIATRVFPPEVNDA